MIPFHRPNLSDAARFAAFKTMDSGWLVAGKQTIEAETKLAEMHQRKHCVLVNSNTSGMDLIFRFLRNKIPHKPSILFPAVNFVGPVGMAVALNFDVWLGDVDSYVGRRPLSSMYHDLNSHDIVVTMPHGGAYAHSGAMYDLCSQAKKLGKYVIEDAAHAFGSKIDGTDNLIGSVQTFASVFSFYATKVVTSIEGGAILTDDDELYEYLMKARLHGISSSLYGRSQDPSKGFMYESEILGRKAAPNDVQASMLLAGLKELDGTIKHNREIAKRYRNATLKGYAQGCSADVLMLDDGSNGHLCKAKVYRGFRDDFITRMAENGVQCSVHYPPLWKMSAFSGKVKHGRLPGAETFSATTVSLPVYNSLTDDEVNKVCDLLEKL